MKKAVAVVCVVLFMLGLTAAVGCGGDEGRAIEEYNKATSLRPEQSEINALDEVIYSLKGTLTDGTITDMQEFQSKMEEIEKLTESIKDKFAEARAEYEKILKLDGAEEIKKITKAVIEAGDTYVQLLDKNNEMLALFAEIAIIHGGVPDTQTEVEFSRQMDELTALSEKLASQTSEVQELIEKSGLGFEGAI